AAPAAGGQRGGCYGAGTARHRGAWGGCSSEIRGLSEADPARARPQADDVHVGGQVERGAVVAEGGVGGRLPGDDRPQVPALGRDDQQPTRPGGEEVPAGVDGEAVGRAALPLPEERRTV